MIVVTRDRAGSFDVACGDCDKPLALITVDHLADVRLEDQPCTCGSLDELRLMVSCIRASDDARRRAPMPASARGRRRDEPSADAA